jgi:hypothetical protein
MKIKELLNDNDLYELWLLLTDGLWDVLMADSDVKEGIYYPRKTMIRANTPVRKVGPARAMIRKPLVPVRKVVKPAKPVTRPVQKQPINKVGLNEPKVDVTKGPNFKLDSMNVFPDFFSDQLKYKSRN